MTFTGKWSMSNKESGITFSEFCQTLADGGFHEIPFKRHPAFIPIIGNDVRSEAEAIRLVKKLKNSSIVTSNIAKFRTNDIVGNPKLYNMPQPFGKISPGTLIFAEVLDIIHNDVIDLNRRSLNIVEIGGGYGGQAKLFKDLPINHSYSIIDIPSVVACAQRYNCHFGHRINAYTTDSYPLDVEWDLVISNWCLSELDDRGIQCYFDTVISKSKNAFVRMNLWNTERIQYVQKLFLDEFDIISVYPLNVHKPGCENWELHAKRS